MNTTPKLARNVKTAKPHEAPKKKFRILWPNLICQIALGIALGLLGVVFLEGIIL